jgi:hypothetical protein
MTTTTKDHDVIDKDGKRVRRNGMLEDGDRIRVPMTLMDAQNPALVAAAALAGSVRRAEQFDMRLHPQTPRYGTTDAASHTAREARDARVRDAWKNPPSVTKNDASALEQVAVVGPNASDAQLFAARDQAIANRDRRLETAWQR